MTQNAAVVYDLPDRYERVQKRLLQYSDSYPTAQALRGRVVCGVPRFGRRPGRGFAEKRWMQNDGVRLLIEALLKEDARPLWIGLWGGANTLAQALWTAQQELSPEAFSEVLKKLRIYSISDQDNAGIWIRKTYGDALFYIVSPS